MKSHIQNNLPQELEIKVRQSLFNANVAGIGYGAKSFAMVIKNMIVNFTGDDKQVLINNIDEFVNKTLENSPQQLSEAFAEVMQRAEDIIGKENNDG